MTSVQDMPLHSYTLTLHILKCILKTLEPKTFPQLEGYFFFFNFKIFNSYMCSHEPPSHLPPHNIPLGHPHAPAPRMLHSSSDIDWQFNSYMIVYMLECHSPKSSHPLPLPLSPKVRYTHLCPFSCLAYRVVIAIFLNSIYMC